MRHLLPPIEKKYIIVVLFIASVLSFCKKKDKSPAEETLSTISQTPASEDSPHTVSTNTTGYVYGVFSSFNSTSNALFFNQPTYLSYQNNQIKVNEVMLNGELITFDSIRKIYNANTPSNLKKEVWKIKGADVIPSFTYTSDNNTPGWSSISLPDSISKSTGFKIIIKGLVNNDGSALLWFFDNTYEGMHWWRINNGDTTITVTPADLVSVTPTNQASFKLAIGNTRILNFFGKDFAFAKSLSYNKYNIKVKP
jgi:hypothetical protein